MEDTTEGENAGMGLDDELDALGSELDEDKSVKANSISVVPMNQGTWRGDSQPLSAMLFTHNVDDVDLHWTLMASPHPRSLLHTGEYDPAIPLTRMRRRWALVLGRFGYEPPLHAVRNHRGYVSLDEVKDWQLHGDGEESAHPRLALSPASVKAVADNIEQHPAYEQVKNLLMFADSAQRRNKLWSGLQQLSPWTGPRGQFKQLLRGGGHGDGQWFWMHYRHGQMAGWAPKADELLAAENLSAERRGKLKEQLAALANALAEPDANPRGSMVHLGNPNMPINRFMALPLVASLIPDHPLADTWLNVSREYIAYKLAMNIAPGGGWSELISYFGASAPSLIRGAMVLEHAGRLDAQVAELASMPARFTLDLLTPPDPRFNARKVPGWGHEGERVNTHWMGAAALNRRRNPELAKAFAWGWDQTGRPMDSHHDNGFSPYTVVHADLLQGLPDDYLPPNFTSTWMPGVGAVLRDRPGTPEEVYFGLRNGYMVSHSDPNQGDFVLSAHGAPLVTLSLHAYPLNQVPAIQELNGGFGWHSRPRFGKQSNAGGWPGGGAYGGIPAYSFSEQADYLRAWGDYNGVRWTRQVMMAKGENTYLVLRDSFRKKGGVPDIWWNMRTLGKKEQVQPTADGFNYASEFNDVTLEARFPGLEQPTVESRDVTYRPTLYFQSAKNWSAAGSPVQTREHANTITVEETMSVNAVGPVKQDVFVILYPRRPDGPELTAERIAPDAVRVTCGGETRTIYMSPEPVADDAFQGLAGIEQDENTTIVCEAVQDPEQAAGKLVAEPEDGLVRMNLHGEQRLEHNGLWAATTGAAADAGEVDLTFHADRVTGTSSGKGRLLYLSFPPKLDRLPVLVIDGQTYAPGTSGDTLIVPIMPGERTFEVRNLEHPPIFRDERQW